MLRSCLEQLEPSDKVFLFDCYLVKLFIWGLVSDLCDCKSEDSVFTQFGDSLSLGIYEVQNLTVSYC